MKLSQTSVTLALGLFTWGLLTACRGPSAEASIRERIVGTWIPQPPADASRFQNLSFSPDGAFSGTITNGATEALGTWQTEARSLVIRLASTNYLTSRWTGKKLPLPLEMRYHIIRIDQHALVLQQIPPITLYGADDQPYVAFSAATDCIQFRR